MQSATKIWQNLPPNKNFNSSLTLRNAPVSKKNIGLGFYLNKDNYFQRDISLISRLVSLNIQCRKNW